jgi:hypothetical protein
MAGAAQAWRAGIQRMAIFPRTARARASRSGQERLAPIHRSTAPDDTSKQIGDAARGAGQTCAVRTGRTRPSCHRAICCLPTYPWLLSGSVTPPPSPVQGSARQRPQITSTWISIPESEQGPTMRAKASDQTGRPHRGWPGCEAAARRPCSLAAASSWHPAAAARQAALTSDVARSARHCLCRTSLLVLHQPPGPAPPSPPYRSGRRHARHHSRRHDGPVHRPGKHGR